MQKIGPSYPVEKENKNKFWLSCFEALKSFHNVSKIKTSSELLTEPVFYNENIRIGGKLVWDQEWFDKEVFNISHFLNEEGKFYTYPEFCTKYNVNLKVMLFNGCISSIKKIINKFNVEIKDNQTKEYPVYLTMIYSIHKGCKLYYNTYVFNKENPNCCSQWQQKLNCDIRWQVVFFKIQKIRETS